MHRVVLGLVLALVTAGSADAHLTYTNRNFGTFDGLEAASATVSNQAVTGNFGWADATDADFGDTHKGRGFRFTLENHADVVLSVSANPSATATSVGGLLPGFTLYAGLVHVTPAAADHDFADVTTAHLATLPGPSKEGAWNALGELVIGNDTGDLSELAFVGYAVDGTPANFGPADGVIGDGLADGFVSRSFHLAPGDYTLLIGGADYSSQDGTTATQPFGLSATLSIVPEPGTATLALLGLAGLGAGRRRSARSEHAPDASGACSPSGTQPGRR